MKLRDLARRAMVMSLVPPMMVVGCAMPAGGPGGGSSGSQNTQASCILAHVATGALLGAAAGGLLGNNSRTAVRGALVGGLAGFATAWMRCIPQYATPTTTQVAPLRAMNDPSLDVQQGPRVLVRSSFLDPSAIESGGRSTMRVAYVVVDKAAEVSVDQTVTFRFVLPDGTDVTSQPRSDRVVIEPGLSSVNLPLEIPPEVTEGKLIATIRLEVNGRSAESRHELLITRDGQRLEAARTEAARQRAQFDRVMAAAQQPASARPAPQVADAGSKSAGGAGVRGRMLVVQIARANLRDQPSAKARQVGVAMRGEKLRIEDEVVGGEGRWFKVTQGSLSAWVGASAGQLE